MIIITWNFFLTSVANLSKEMKKQKQVDFSKKTIFLHVLLTITRRAVVKAAPNLSPRYCLTVWIMIASVAACTCASPGHEVYDIVDTHASLKNLENKFEYGNLIWHLDQLKERLSSLQKYAEASVTRINEQYTCVLDDFASFRKQIIEALDYLGSSIKKEAEKIRATDTENMEIIHRNSKEVEEKLQSLSKELEIAMLGSQNDELEAQIKTTSATLGQMDEELKELEARTVTEYKFVEHDLQDLVTTVTDSGKLRILPKEIKCVPAYDITLGANQCNIVSSVMVPQNKLVIATSDKEHSCIEVIDTVHDAVVQKLGLPSRLWDMTRLQGNRLAVTQYKNRKVTLINFNSTEPLHVETEMHLSGECYGLASLKDDLVVTFRNPARVVVMDTTGNILKSFYKDSAGENLFSFPCNVAVSADGQSIYVSDYNKATVTNLDLDGRVQTIYASDDLKRPRKIFLDTLGLVYVCGQASNNVHVLSPTLKMMKVLQLGAVPKLFGVIKLYDLCVPGPLSIHVCEKTDRLYVGMYNQNKVRVFQLL